jgi:hypothetical protein
MAEFQWWLLLVGLVAGGGLVAVVTMDGRRREEDLADLEREAEANWIAERVHGLDRDIDGRTVESILRIHREYLSLPPPDRIVVGGSALADADADRDPDEIGDDGSRRPDEDLSRT